MQVGCRESSGCGDEAEASQCLDPARSVALHGELLIVDDGVPVIFATLEHEKEGAQHFVSQSDDGAFVATANDQRPEPGLERRFCAAGGVSELTEESANVAIALADTFRLTLSGRVVARADADPGSEAVWRAEDAHVATDFDQPHGGTDEIDARHGLQQGQRTSLARQLAEQAAMQHSFCK